MDVQAVETLLALFDEVTLAPSEEAVISLKVAVQGVIVDLNDKVQILQDQETTLRVQLEEMQQMALPKPVDGFYTLEEFTGALLRKRGQTYGWKVDYVTATNTPDCRVAKNEDIQAWQKTNKVPDWAFEQIDRLIFPKRTGKKGQPPWLETEYDYLEFIYKEDPTRSNIVLVDLCTKKFGRSINEPAIKGALDRLRKKGRIDKYRPKKQKKAA